VRELRVGAGLTQTELAGGRFSKEYVSQVERGKTRPSSETLAWLAQRLGTDRQYLEDGLSESDAHHVAEMFVMRDRGLLADTTDGVATVLGPLVGGYVIFSGVEYTPQQIAAMSPQAVDAWGRDAAVVDRHHVVRAVAAQPGPALLVDGELDAGAPVEPVVGTGNRPPPKGDLGGGPGGQLRAADSGP